MRQIARGHLSQAVSPSIMQCHEIKSFTYSERQSVLARLGEAFAACGGWILERRAVSSAATTLRVEIQLRDIVELYAALVEGGLELTRAAHLSLADLCTCRRNLRAVDLGQLVTLDIEISFLEDVTLHSLLSTAAAPA